MSAELKRFVVYSLVIFAVSIGYAVYVFMAHPPTPETETLLSEIGEGIGEIAMWAFIFIYLRTVLKLVMGKGPMARRLLPEYKAPAATGVLQSFIVYLDRTHIYVGVAALALGLIHIAFVGLHVEILFFPLVLALMLWQGLFGMFISWRGAPKNLKKWSYSVHAQLVTGVGIGVFAFFGHMLIDN